MVQPATSLVQAGRIPVQEPRPRLDPCRFVELGLYFLLLSPAQCLSEIYEMHHCAHAPVEDTLSKIQESLLL